MSPPTWPTRSVDISQISRRVLPRACGQHRRALEREPCQAKVVAGGCTPSVNRPLLKRFRQLSCLPTARRLMILRCHLFVLPKCSLSRVASGVSVVHTASSKPGYSFIGCTQLFALLRLGTASGALCVGRSLPCGPGDMLSIHPGQALRELTCVVTGQSIGRSCKTVRSCRLCGVCFCCQDGSYPARRMSPMVSLCSSVFLKQRTFAKEIFAISRML